MWARSVHVGGDLEYRIYWKEAPHVAQVHCLMFEADTPRPDIARALRALRDGRRLAPRPVKLDSPTQPQSSLF
ncbi:hypothetical protein LJR168_003895 [Pseudoxanthomonas sp. LjRoot168]|uniref:hypothetical protein n=1 Tax=unclassified Pseudoxanthomonas TaxID=2645906 RepID=UPI003ECF6A71